MRLFKVLSFILPLALTSHPSPCPKYSTWMIESIISRGEGISAADGLLGEIQKGFFQEALREAVERTDNASQATRWSNYHNKSVQTGINDFLNATADAQAPLDRLCAGRSLLQVAADGKNDRAALKALRKSVDLQLRNTNGGFWYFVDPPPPYETYGNLSYSDGMYGFAPFAALYEQIYGDSHLNLETVLHQFELIYDHCLHKDTGLIVHGYDASRRAPWAHPVTGASPIVWGRSLAWYTIGLVDVLEIAGALPDHVHARSFQRIRTIFQRLALAETAAIRTSAQTTGRYGVWQVFDMPGAPSNFVEASATAMITYALAKGVRLGYLHGFDDHGVHPYQKLRDVEDVLSITRAMYNDLLAHFIVHKNDGTLDYTGTSIISSLHVPKPDYYYYTHRNVTTNSLIGTSAFVLASLELER